MNLFINTPAYYGQVHGIDEEIYKMSSIISKNIDVTQYTDLIDTIGIVPIIAPMNEGWEEDKRISLTYRMASIALRSNYDEYCDGDINIKKKIIVENIVESLKVIKKRLKGKFDYEQMVQDIENLVSCMET